MKNSVYGNMCMDVDQNFERTAINMSVLLRFKLRATKSFSLKVQHTRHVHSERVARVTPLPWHSQVS